ncbi:hypothetical protein C7B80_32305 [Cyanosarcina cf. burmensis CCALA 770]|nr:hypothetical protein C7B80_32305 [Cyanosarcina cf. burmensis CCALA 770]
MPRKMHRNSLANLNPRNRDQGKVRFNTTLKPETIAWLQAGGNASGRIEKLVALAQSGYTHEQNNSDDTHEWKALEDRLHKAEQTLNVIAAIIQRWEEKAANRNPSTPRWENVIKLVGEVRTEL